jgi:hypothetical protein
MRNAPVCCPRYLLRKHISSACLGVPVSVYWEVTLRLRDVVLDSEQDRSLGLSKVLG